MNKMSEKILGRLRVFATIAAVTLVAAVATVAAPQEARALTPDGDGVYHIRTVAEWKAFADASRTDDFAGKTVVLDDDLDFSSVDFSGIDSNAYTVGPDKERPFRGTFNGGDYTISNFSNERTGLEIQMDCGLFGWTDEAVIKNLNVKDSYVGASYRGGMIVGVAQDTFLLNILCENCTTSVIPVNNVLNLITNAGISGGTIAGVTNGSTLYNCEMRGGRVVTNATAGVAALGGQPLYMGGLVGQANDTVIEYSRVTNLGDAQPEISNTYETAVSVANYSEVFTGGIVGAIQGEDTGTKIVDCYSTAYVHSKAAIYFGVGLGLGVTRGYTGGIVGVIYSGEDGHNLIQRVSFAGTLGSYVYNQVLLGIPAIETNKYLGAIAGLNRNEDTTVIQDVYYKNAQTADKDGDPRSVPAYLSNYAASTVTYGESFGPNTSSYASRDFWENANFDMAGGVSVDLGNAYEFTQAIDEGQYSEWSKIHYNKWTMDYKNGMPVHGGSIKATMDFPGSGTVTIGETGLAGAGHEQSTNNPYDFAVQGFLPNDKEITVTFAPNDGYQFMGWFRSRGVLVNDIDQNHDLFTEKSDELNTESGLLAVGGDYDLSKTDNPLTVTWPTDEQDPQQGDYSDNDLYVAYVQARVQLHDVEGNVLQHDGAGNIVTENGRSDWYDYGNTITLPSSLAGSAGTFVGWTMQANGDGTGYSSIDSATLAQLRENGLLWEPGSTYTVTSAADLYPVFTTYDNVRVIYEGHDDDDLATRSGYGQAVMSTNQESGDLILSITPFENSPLGSTVRFLGWYEYVGEQTDVNGADADTAATNWLRVSRDETFNVSESGADLTGTHIYKARFEYRVDYKYYHLGNENWDEPYAQIWEYYNDPFNNIDGPDYRAFYHDHWGTDGPSDTGNVYACSNDGHAITDATLVEKPLTVYSHSKDDGSNKNIIVTTDFPGGPEVSIEYRNIMGNPDPNGYYLHALIDTKDCNGTNDASKHYWFHGWVYDGLKTSKDPRTQVANDFDFGSVIATGENYGAEHWIEAHVTGRVQFHGVPSFGTKTVERRYGEKVFLDSTSNYTKPYHYQANKGESQTEGQYVGSTSEAFSFNTSMDRDGYVFLGWIDLSDTDVSKVIDVIAPEKLDNGEAYVAKSGSSVAAYLLTGTEVCTRPMELYPVYAPAVQIETTTNVRQAGVIAGAGINVPMDPSVTGVQVEGFRARQTVNYNADGGSIVNNASPEATLYFDDSARAQVTIAVDEATLVTEGGETYKLTSLQVEDRTTGQTQTLSPNADGAFTHTVTAGGSYVYTANYDPLAVVYHVAPSKAEGPTAVVTRNRGELLGNAPVDEDTLDANFSMNNQLKFFVGWTERRPVEGDCVINGEGVTLVSPDTPVTRAMELWPVYQNVSINLVSNIDGTYSGHLRMRRNGDGVLIEATDVANHRYDGWYKGDHSDGTVVESDFLSSEGTYYLPKADALKGGTYTAIYTSVREIRYRDTNGDVIYTARVAKDENRTFVQTVTVDGEEVESPIDVEAFSQIIQQLNAASSAPDATVRESFSTWQYIGADGKPVSWDAFKNESAYTLAGDDGVLDIYPVTWRMSAEDSAGANYTSKLTWSGDAVENGDGTSGVAQSIRVTFKDQYLQPYLDVIVNEASYGVANEPDLTGQPNIKVFAYDKDESTLLSEGVTGNVKADDPGRARLYFNGMLAIQKTLESASSSDQVFYFTVTGSDTASRTVAVAVKANEITGSTTLKLPYGEYTVVENDAWAWRYNSSIDAEGKVTVSSNATVTCKNTLDEELGTKWFDGSDFIRNTFGEKGGE